MTQAPEQLDHHRDGDHKADGDQNGDNARPKDATNPKPGEAGGDSHGGEHEEVIPHDLKKPGGLTVAIALGLFVLLLIGLFLVGYFPHRAREQQAAADAKDAQESQLPIVDVARPKPETSTQDVILPADVRPLQDTYLYTRATGFLKAFHVDIGDTVTQGQSLAEIATPDVDAQLVQSKAALEVSKTNVTKAQADLDLAKTTLQRYIDAQKDHPGSVTQEDVDTRKSAYNDAISALGSANAAVDQAQANVKQLEATQQFNQIAAPFNGVVTSRNYDVGALLSPTDTGPGKELFHVAEIDVLRVFVNVPQSYATSVKTNQPAYLMVRNYPGEEFPGTIVRTAGAIDPNSRTLSVEVHFANKDGRLFAGMYGQVRLPVPSTHPVLVVPSSALVFNAQGSQVAVVNKDNKVNFKKIVVGRDLGTQLEIASGVDDTERVVNNPGEKLTENGDVKVVDEDAKQADADHAAPGSARAATN